ncbi:unnamed protein product [Somion occarium]|uniref:Response regulatory domain-containing protein n=1 Tax=Somion occarium TaxID=3059160 RepID=A0ABP1DJI5_9APHY
MLHDMPSTTGLCRASSSTSRSSHSTQDSISSAPSSSTSSSPVSPPCTSNSIPSAFADVDFRYSPPPAGPGSGSESAGRPSKPLPRTRCTSTSTTSSSISTTSSSTGTGSHPKIVPPAWAVPPRVLLVDDDVVYRMLSKKLLQVFGCMIDIAVDGAAAVAKMNLEKYDLVFMDIMMPKLDGRSATSLIRKFDHLTPIISVTSNYHPDEVVSYYLSGMNDVLPKPFTRDGVHGILEKHLVHLKAIQSASTSTTASSSPIIPPPVTPTPPSTPIVVPIPPPLSDRLASPCTESRDDVLNAQIAEPLPPLHLLSGLHTTTITASLSLPPSPLMPSTPPPPTSISSISPTPDPVPSTSSATLVTSPISVSATHLNTRAHHVRYTRYPHHRRDVSVNASKPLSHPLLPDKSSSLPSSSSSSPHIDGPSIPTSSLSGSYHPDILLGRHDSLKRRREGCVGPPRKKGPKRPKSGEGLSITVVNRELGEGVAMVDESGGSAESLWLKRSFSSPLSPVEISIQTEERAEALTLVDLGIGATDASISTGRSS